MFGDVQQGASVSVAVPGLHGVYGATRSVVEQAVLLAPGRPSTLTLAVRALEPGATILRVRLDGRVVLEIAPALVSRDATSAFTVALPEGQGSGIARVRLEVDGASGDEAYLVVEAQVVLGSVVAPVEAGSMR